ncbi:MAG: hypothetical protein PHO98_10870, partial [Synergistaceae bacterium]|nr:hypothetical protein [Synergistaceae bacterium]
HIHSCTVFCHFDHHHDPLPPLVVFFCIKKPEPGCRNPVPACVLFFSPAVLVYAAPGSAGYEEAEDGSLRKTRPAA